MTYSRLEINLLPPELRPRPAVRLGPVLVLLLVFGTFAAIALNVTLALLRIADLKTMRANLESQLDDKANLVLEYTDLVRVRDSIGRYGRIIALASSGYNDLPLVLEHISWVLPDGVYIQEIGSERKKNPGEPLTLALLLRVSKEDPWLVQRTLSAFKNDPLLRECYIKSAAVSERSMSDFLEQFSITWAVEGPDIEDTLLTPEYEVELHIRLPQALPELRPAVLDKNEMYQDFILKDAPPPSEADDSKPAEESPAKPAGAAPAGVTAEAH